LSIVVSHHCHLSVGFPVIHCHLSLSPVPVMSCHLLLVVRWFIYNYGWWQWYCDGCGCVGVGSNRVEVVRGWGRRRGGRHLVVVAMLLSMVGLVCTSYLLNKSGKHFETQPEKPTKPAAQVWVSNGYLKHDLYPYPSNPYPHTCTGLRTHDMHYTLHWVNK